MSLIVVPARRQLKQQTNTKEKCDGILCQTPFHMTPFQGMKWKMLKRSRRYQILYKGVILKVFWTILSLERKVKTTGKVIWLKFYFKIPTPPTLRNKEILPKRVITFPSSESSCAISHPVETLTSFNRNADWLLATEIPRAAVSQSTFPNNVTFIYYIYNIVLYCIVLYYIILYYIILYMWYVQINVSLYLRPYSWLHINIHINILTTYLYIYIYMYICIKK